MSVFSSIPPSEWTADNTHAFAIRDRHAVTTGHTLVVSKREVPTWFEATPEERIALMALVDVVKAKLDSELHPDGYNVGFNAGEAAGQTVPHLHVHVIPRYRGDMDDPRGGVRHVIPSRGHYLRRVAPLATGGDNDAFAKHILPLFEVASEVAIVAAFVQESGLDRIRVHVNAALSRGAHVRILTGDYLEITQASALKMLLDWQRASRAEDDGGAPSGVLEARIVEAGRRSFHPKAYRFEGERFAIAYVGSSNLSRVALEHGVEWNVRVDRDRDEVAYRQICAAFESAWGGARVLDEAWVDAYAKRAAQRQQLLPPWELDAEPFAPLPPPHLVQREALEQLATSRASGRRRALVVLATGLGKTALAAYDYQQLRETLGRRPRLLFLAHRRELLTQAAATYRRLLRDHNDDEARISWFVEDADGLDGDLVFASVAKLSRPDHLDRLGELSFDYVVVDEVHHAAADSYRRILSAIDPGFLLGLTATPDRTDAADILGLFDDHVAYRADIPRGVAIQRLVPFHYFGVKDEIDYENIPWRNKRFDPELLAEAAQTAARMDAMWRAWNAHEGTRSLVFCCSIAHAVFVRGWLRDHGVKVRAVFSGEGSDDRDDAISALRDGTIEAVCSVDVFNEGVDVPSVDRVVMLRPTESSVIFLQQLGRGLRASEGKQAVTVIDFVGNHRMFLERVRTLLSLASGARTLGVREFLSTEGPAELPAGCSVDLELDAKELLSKLFRSGGADEVERAYRELRDERDRRPTAGELQRMGYLPSKVRERHGSWFDFVQAEGDLTPDEHAVREVAGAFLRDVEVTEMTRSFKMVTLEALLEAGRAATIRDVALRSYAILRRSPELWADVATTEQVELGPETEAKWVAYWRRNPIAAWVNPKAGRRTWFKLEGDRLTLDLAVAPASAATFERLTHELVDYRLAQYRARHRQVSGEGFTCKVISNQRDPILKLPTRTTELPHGEVDVRLPDGAVWQFRFADIAINVARPAGTQLNKLPDLLRTWFGPTAGRPGTTFEVRFSASPDGLWIAPSQTNVVALAERRGIVAYPDLRAAAGHGTEAIHAPDAERVMLPMDADGDDLFAVRVSGTSMDGGKSPMRDGDWVILRPIRGASASAVDGRVVLAEVPSDAFGSRYHIKRLLQRDGRWTLASDNPDGPTIDITANTTPIARVERTVRPEDLAPPIGTILRDDLAERFGLTELTARSGRHEGHLFIFIDAKGILEAPDRVRYTPDRTRPGETAYVLTLENDGSWQYRGVGRTLDDGAWRIPDVDFATWRTWGEGRSASRAIPDGALARAQLGVDALTGVDAIEHNGKRARILGVAERGGLRLDGGDGGFAERTVSLTDLAWVVVADDDITANGGVLDEERVNRARYLEGTPKGSTRWIDSQWAIALWLRAKPRIREVVASTEVPERKVRRGKRTLDATFRVEPVGDGLSVVIESRGGTKGSAAERNTDYNEGFELILERLGAAGMQITDAVVDSEKTDALEHDQRRLRVAQEYPIAITDAAALRREMSRAQARVGRSAGARGSGNATRRVRLYLAALKGPVLSADTLARTLEGTQHVEVER